MLALSITCLLRLPDRGPQVLFHLSEQTRPESLHESWDAIMLPSGWIIMGILCVYIYIHSIYIYRYRYSIYIYTISIYIYRYSIHLRPQLIPMMPFIFHPHFASRNFSATKLPTVLGQHFFHRLTLVNSPALAERRVVPVASSHLFTSLHISSHLFTSLHISSHLFTLSLVYWCLLTSVLPNPISEKYWAWQLVEWQSLQIGGSGAGWCPDHSPRSCCISSASPAWIDGAQWSKVGTLGAAAWSPGHCAGVGETYCNHGGMLALNHLGQQTCLEHV